MLDKFFQRFKPKGIDTVSPLHELYDDLKNSAKGVVTCVIVSFILADLLSGVIYFLFARIFNSRLKLVITTCFKNGISKMLIPTILLTLLFCYIVFKAFRSLKRNYTKNYDDNYLKADQETYGGAHFQSEEELKENFTIVDTVEETDKEIFGADKKGKIYAFNYPRGLNYNRVYIGSPGAGKSDAIIKNSLYQAIKRGESVILTDTKGDLYAETSAAIREMGITVRLLNFKPTEFKNSDGWNLFQNLRADDPTLDAQADIIADTIIKNTTSSEKEVANYWGTNEFNLLKFLIMYVASDPTYVSTGRNTLPEMFNLLATSNPKMLAGMAAGIPKTNPARQCYDIFANCKEENQGQIINGAAIRLAKLTNQFLQEALSHNDIDPILPMKEQCVYYVVMSDTTDAYKFLTSLFFTTTFQLQCNYSDQLSEEEKEKQIPVLYLMDEYKNTGGIQTLPVNIAAVRSRLIALIIMLQDLGQLTAVHGEENAATILNSCDIKCLLKTGDKLTAEYFSYLLGNQTVMIENQRYYEDSADIIHAKNIIQKTMGEGQRPLMLPEELVNGKLSLDELIYVVSGMPPIRLNKYFASGAKDKKTGKYKNPPHPMELHNRELGLHKCCNHEPEWKNLENKDEAETTETATQTSTKVTTQKNTAAEAPKVKTPEPVKIPEPVKTTTKPPQKSTHEISDIEALFDDIL